MNIRKHTLGMFGAALALFAAVGVAAAADRPYTEGAVLNVSSIRTEPGMFDSYMSYLADDVQAEDGGAEGRRRHPGLQRVHGRAAGSGRSGHLPRDRLQEHGCARRPRPRRLDPIQQKIFGDISQRNAATIARGKMRTQLGSEMIREIKLK